MPRFVQAFGRARQVAHDLFQPSRRLFGIVAASEDTRNDLFAPADDGFAALHAAGFAATPVREWREPLWPAHEDDEPQPPALWRAFDLTGDLAARDVLLWCSVAYEMGITPTAPVISYLADFDRGVTLYVYDDRGMDVTAFEPGPLRELYAARDEWLLDYDRERMAEAFG